MTVTIPDSLLGFAGFSLEKRQERPHGPWRCRVLPNKNERENCRIEAYGETEQQAVDNAETLLIDRQNSDS